MISASKALLYFVQNENGPPLNVQGASNSNNNSNNNTNQSFTETTDQSVSGISWKSEEEGGGNWWTKSQIPSADEDEANDLYNTFRFWRVPLDVLDTYESSEPEQDDIRTDLNNLDVCIS